MYKSNFIIFSWEQRKLGEVGKARSGFGFPDDEQGGIKGIPFFKVSDMNADGNENEMLVANNYVTEEQITTHRWNPISDLPAIFFAKVGAAVLLNRKRLCRFPFLLDNNTMAYSLGNNYWDADFAKALFETIDLTTLVQVGALPSYNTGDVEAVLVCLPKLIEQRKIGCYFKEIDNLITLHQCEQNALYWIQNCTFTFFSISWEQRKLGESGTTFTGLSGKSKEDFGHGTANFVTYMNVYLNPIADKSRIEKIEIDNSQNTVRYGDIFFTTSSETPEEVGMSSIWLENMDNIYLNSFCFGFRSNLKFNPYYMAYQLRSPLIRKKIILLAQGISRYNISKNKLLEISISLPKYEEQEKIGNLFYKLDNLITLHQCEQIIIFSKVLTMIS